MIRSAKAVFLSYASEDADAARRVCDSLRAVDVEKWWDPGFIEQLAEGWRKAGLAMDPVKAARPLL
jgi:hypothetical protein